MVADREVRVPVGPEARRWATVAAERTVLVAVRTVTSAARALEAVAHFAGDNRVQVVFAINGSSPFVDGVRRFLSEAGARIVPWRQVPRLRFDAIVTASENTELAGVDAPVLVLPHGVGFHKFVPDSRGSGRRLSGSVRTEELAGRRVQIVVSHPDQAGQLREHDPDSPAEPVVVADPVFERLRASEWFRDRYRQRLGTAGRRLVVVSSTWGGQSLLGRWPDAPVRLLAGLPADEYQVAAVLHPNVWSGHGAWQVRSWLADAREGGLAVVAPDTGWPAVLVAADCVVGDHGSVSLYAAGLDRPLLLAPFGDEVVPGTALSMLGDTAPLLLPDRPWPEQVAAAIATHVPGRYRQVVARTFTAAPPARTLRSVLYELISLPEPSAGAPRPGWPEPRVDRVPTQSYAVYTRRSTMDEVQLRRIPAAVDSSARPGPDGGRWLRHLAVDEAEWDLRLVHSASVLVREEPGSRESAAAWGRRALDRVAGAQIAAAATAGGCVAVLRDGTQLAVSAAGEDRCDVMLQAGCVHQLWHTGELTEDRKCVV